MHANLIWNAVLWHTDAVNRNWWLFAIRCGRCGAALSRMAGTNGRLDHWLRCGFRCALYLLFAGCQLHVVSEMGLVSYSYSICTRAVLGWVCPTWRHEPFFIPASCLSAIEKQSEVMRNMALDSTLDRPSPRLYEGYLIPIRVLEFCCKISFNNLLVNILRAFDDSLG